MIIVFEKQNFTEIPGYEGLYAINHTGDVLRIDRISHFGDAVNHLPAKILKRVKSPTPIVVLTKNGIHTHWHVSKLLERTFP